ncbi:MAG: TRAM domain-containing protein [Clostridiales bacterium]|nr:TRAM domain-containing protein [Eubacteriales bacterium]MDH7567585.1 TRAM domain-containing protein [Clostridiales bacterium]
MLNKIIKISFSIVGAVTGFTLTRSFLFMLNMDIRWELKVVLYCFGAMLIAAIFYSTANFFVEYMMKAIDKLERLMQKMSLYELVVSAVGLIVGLIIANLVTIPVNRIDVIGAPIAIIANILFGCAGVSIAVSKKNEHFLDAIINRSVAAKNKKALVEPKILDTNIIIDGRIVDICRSGFLEGELIVPNFVLEELRHIADSSDSLKRNRGRRGLDVLSILQKDLGVPVRIENIEVKEGMEVDDKLLAVAKKLHGKVITIDYNLSKVADFQGVPVLNINELANAMKPIALPGEEMTVQIIKDGKENGQGIGYLEDGTMIVVDGGRRHIGEHVNVTVTSVLQTAAGRMIFAKPKYAVERAI